MLRKIIRKPQKTAEAANLQSTAPQHQSDLKHPVENDGKPRLPQERDETSDSQITGPRKVIRQAQHDIERGLVDTDMHGQRGVEKAVKPAVKSHS